jgi:hypothetical protein
MAFVPKNGWLYNADQLNKTVTNPAFGRTVTASTTLAKTDSGKTLIGNSASAVVFTIPNDTTVSWADMESVTVLQRGAGTVSFAAGAGVTLRAPAGPAAGVQYGFITAVRIGANEWTLAQ